MAKVRVYELAKELGVESKTVLSMLKDMGEFVRSASSTVEAPVERRLKEKLASEPPPVKKAPAKKAAAKKRTRCTACIALSVIYPRRLLKPSSSVRTKVIFGKAVGRKSPLLF